MLLGGSGPSASAWIAINPNHLTLEAPCSQGGADRPVAPYTRLKKEPNVESLWLGTAHFSRVLQNLC